MKSIADTILMVRPAKFYSNPDTSNDNSFQKFTEQDLTLQAQQEFDHAVELLKTAEINVCVIQDTEYPETPDSIFPNNRISFHQSDKAIIYPMMAVNRRLERQLETLSFLEQNFNIQINSKFDLSHFESQNKFLEGTGSMILDRKNKILYVALSQRSNQQIVELFAKEMGYQSIIFNAKIETENGFSAIYHTNVMMAIAEDFVVIADNCIEENQQSFVLQSLKSSNRQIISITKQQMEHFCGNILQLVSKNGEKIIVMSNTAYKNFTTEQLAIINENNTIISTPIATIEEASGGSIRCMIAEIF